MSIPVDPRALGAELGRFGRAGYLLTVGDERAHAVAVRIEGDGPELAVTPVGGRTAANVAARPAVTVLWPPFEPGGYTLLADGTATIDADATTVRVSVERAVLHRPAPGGPPA
ncbi:MAG: pyridoxamine 5'-phosphate oxidase family protein [Acidimicrobiales bacterium]